MEAPKISFGFSKLTKKPNVIASKVLQPQTDGKVELIDCLEGQSIKVKNAVEEVKLPLVIPLKDDKKNLFDRIRESKKHAEIQQSEAEDTRPDSELTPDELVARHLIREAKQRLANGTSSNGTKVSVLPVTADTLSLEGEKEPTLEDYESVPISDYGMAILRGMGWNEGMPIGKNTSKSAAVSIPELRPKGLGLGATKVIQSELPAKPATDKDGNELVLKAGACARVIAGAQKGNYCEVQGFDEEAGRVIIKVYPKGEIVNINELMITPVTKEDFLKGYKILNNAKYEEYKEISDKKLDDYKIKAEPTSSKHVKKEVVSLSEESDDESESRNRRKSNNKPTEHRKHSHRSKSPRNQRESASYRSKSRSPAGHRKRDSDKRHKKDKHKKDRRSRSKSGDDKRSYSSKHKSKSKSRHHRRNSSDSSSDERKHRRHNRN